MGARQSSSSSRRRSTRSAEGRARLPQRRGRAGHRQDAAARRAARARRRTAATWCWPARPRSSSATCRSASGRTRSTPTWLLRSPAARTWEPSCWTSSRRAAQPPQAGGSPTRRSRTSATGPTAPCAPCSSGWPSPNALVLVLDDLHWADTASIELLAALLRRGPEAPVLLAFAFRRGQAPERLSAALAVPALLRIELEQLSEAQAAELLGDVDAPRRSRTSTATAAATRSTSSSSRARARRAGRWPRRRRTATARRDVPAAVAAALSEELESLSPPARGLLERRGRGRRAVRAGPGGRGRPSSRRPRAWTRSTTCWPWTSCARPRCRAVRLPPPARAARGATSPRAGAGGSPPTPGRPRRSRRAAPPPASARTTWSSRPARATRRRSRSCSRQAPRRRAGRPAAAARWFEAALRLLPAADRDRQVDLRVSLASAQRSLGALERCRETLLEATDLLPEDSVAPACGAHRRCAPPWSTGRAATTRPIAPGRGVGGASRARHHRVRGAAGRAGGGRPLRARLRPDAARWDAPRSRPPASSATGR